MERRELFHIFAEIAMKISMLKIEKMMVNPCQECTHVVSDETGEAVIIDCGVFYSTERRRLLAYLEREGLRPVRLLLTHAHHDHVYGNDLILEHYGLLPEVHEADQQLMESQLPQRIMEIYGENYPYPLPMPAKFLHDGDRVRFGVHSLQVIGTPGHTPGSVVFHCEEEKLAFTGDTLFAMSIGRTDLPGGDELAMHQSLQHLLELLPDDTVIYPGHGKKSTFGHEKACNPFL